jgi:hypothetical protein
VFSLKIELFSSVFCQKFFVPIISFKNDNEKLSILRRSTNVKGLAYYNNSQSFLTLGSGPNGLGPWVV